LIPPALPALPPFGSVRHFLPTCELGAFLRCLSRSSVRGSKRSFRLRARLCSARNRALSVLFIRELSPTRLFLLAVLELTLPPPFLVYVQRFAVSWALCCLSSGRRPPLPFRQNRFLLSSSSGLGRPLALVFFPQKATSLSFFLSPQTDVKTIFIRPRVMDQTFIFLTELGVISAPQRGFLHLLPSEGTFSSEDPAGEWSGFFC